MENLILTIQSKYQILNYLAEHHLMTYEAGIFKEILDAIEIKNQTQLDWFSSFGNSFRSITMNVYAYRKGLEFGFTNISFERYGWFTRAEFHDKENLNFGDTSSYGNYSVIYLGRGVNDIWTYGMNYSYGVAGGCYGLSVYGKQFKNRQEALNVALNELKTIMTKKIGSADNTNDKQPIILATLRDISKTEVNMVQLTLF